MKSINPKQCTNYGLLSKMSVSWVYQIWRSLHMFLNEPLTVNWIAPREMNEVFWLDLYTHTHTHAYTHPTKGLGVSVRLECFFPHVGFFRLHLLLLLLLQVIPLFLSEKAGEKANNCPSSQAENDFPPQPIPKTCDYYSELTAGKVAKNTTFWLQSFSWIWSMLQPVLCPRWLVSEDWYTW